MLVLNVGYAPDIAKSALWRSGFQSYQDQPKTSESGTQAHRNRKVYRNDNYNFSFQYPAGDWLVREGSNMSGASLTPREKSKFRQSPEIGVGGAVGQPSDADPNRVQILEEDMQSRLAAMKEYGHARNLVVLSKKSMRIQGLPALMSTDKYQDSATGLLWFDKQILVHTSEDSTSYHLDLHCSPGDAAILLPIFDRIVLSFRILGPRA